MEYEKVNAWTAEACGVRRTKEDCHKWYYPEWFVKSETAVDYMKKISGQSPTLDAGR